MPMQVVFCRMSPLQARLYAHFLASPPVVRALQVRVGYRGRLNRQGHSWA